MREYIAYLLVIPIASSCMSVLFYSLSIEENGIYLRVSGMYQTISQRKCGNTLSFCPFVLEIR
jgi:hypothetical protein